MNVRMAFDLLNSINGQNPDQFQKAQALLGHRQ